MIKHNMKDSGMCQLNNPDYPKVQVGRFTVLKQSEDSIWIQDGEDNSGGAFSNEIFEKAILEFFNKNF